MFERAREHANIRRLVAVVLLGALGHLALGGLRTPVAGVHVSALVANTVTADAYVSSASPTTNHGTEAGLEVGNNAHVNTYLQVTTDAAPAAAAVYLHATASGSGASIHLASASAWTETGITYANAPSYGTTLATAGPFATGSWVGFDVSSVVTTPGTYTFVLTSDANSIATFSSRESGPGTVPYLTMTTASSPTSAPTPTATGTAMYVHYYLWWTPQHWTDKLGTLYPYTATPLPVPGAMDSTGCNPTLNYVGSQIVDIPTEGLYDQGVAATLDHHIDLAARAGIHGFIANWQGTGATGQSPSSSGYDSRLDLLVQRVDAYNSTHTTRFGLALGMDAYGNYSRPAGAILNDLAYFQGRYGSDPAFTNAFDPRPMVMLLDSRKLLPTVGQSGAILPQVSAQFGTSLYVLGDETYLSWPTDGAYLAGTSYYWSSEDPVNNSGAQSQIDQLGSEVAQSGKKWFAPVIAGYNKQLLGGTNCVARNGLKMLDLVWSTNKTSNPTAWFAISWNEFVENTYLEPSRTYGSTYLDELARLIAAG